MQAKYQACVYKKYNGNDCSGSLDNIKEDYANCRMGVEMYIFVFLFKDIILEYTSEIFNPWGSKCPSVMIFGRIFVTVAGLVGWTI